MREAIASLHGIANSLPPEINLDAIDRALEGDPNSARLLWYKTMQELRRGRTDRAAAPLRRLERLGPGWPQTRNARQIFELVLSGVALEDEP